jgi:hypothetical protein
MVSETRAAAPTTATGIRSKLSELETELTLLKEGRQAKPFRFPNKWRTQINKGKKNEDGNKILVVFLNAQGIWEPPKFCQLISGDIIVMPNLKAYEIDPRDITVFAGCRAYVCREIDRKLVPVARPEATREGYTSDIEPISNTDYEEVMTLGRSTANHPTLLKAILAARAEQIQPKKKMSFKVIIIGLVIAIVVIILLVNFLPKG